MYRQCGNFILLFAVITCSYIAELQTVLVERSKVGYCRDGITIQMDKSRSIWRMLERAAAAMFSRPEGLMPLMFALRTMLIANAARGVRIRE